MATNDISNLTDREDIQTLLGGLVELDGSATWDASSIADGDEEAKEVTVTGASLGDFAQAALSIDTINCICA